MAHDNYGGDMYEDGPNTEHMSKLQIFLQRSALGWPLYTVIISLGQLLSAVSPYLSLLSSSLDTDEPLRRPSN